MITDFILVFLVFSLTLCIAYCWCGAEILLRRKYKRLWHEARMWKSHSFLAWGEVDRLRGVIDKLMDENPELVIDADWRKSDD